MTAAGCSRNKVGTQPLNPAYATASGHFIQNATFGKTFPVSILNKEGSAGHYWVSTGGAD